jgi:hypothetical protein
MDSGEKLRPLGGWDVITRGRFEAVHAGHQWVIDLGFFDPGERIALYRDGQLVDEARSPASFDLDSRARIVASLGVLGMKEAALEVDGVRTMLTPAVGTGEAWRLGLERQRPGLSRAIGFVSVAVLLVALVVDGSEILGLIDRDLDPLGLPGLVAAIAGFLALGAAIERALRLKCNRWLD